MMLSTPDPRSRGLDIIYDLIRAKGISRFGIFGEVCEGKPLPGGLESASGLVVTADGEMYSFWFDWDESGQRPALTRWCRVEPAPEWEQDEEYQAAWRAAMGLENGPNPPD